jgi:hypothetical protein
VSIQGALRGDTALTLVLAGARDVSRKWYTRTRKRKAENKVNVRDLESRFRTRN